MANFTKAILVHENGKLVTQLIFEDQSIYTGDVKITDPEKCQIMPHGSGTFKKNNATFDGEFQNGTQIRGNMHTGDFSLPIENGKIIMDPMEFLKQNNSVNRNILNKVPESPQPEKPQNFTPDIEKSANLHESISDTFENQQGADNENFTEQKLRVRRIGEKSWTTYGDIHELFTELGSGGINSYIPFRNELQKYLEPGKNKPKYVTLNGKKLIIELATNKRKMNDSIDSSEDSDEDYKSESVEEEEYNETANAPTKKRGKSVKIKGGILGNMDSLKHADSISQLFYKLGLLKSSNTSDPEVKMLYKNYHAKLSSHLKDREQNPIVSINDIDYVFCLEENDPENTFMLTKTPEHTELPRKKGKSMSLVLKYPDPLHEVEYFTDINQLLETVPDIITKDTLINEGFSFPFSLNTSEEIMGNDNKKYTLYNKKYYEELRKKKLQSV